MHIMKNKLISKQLDLIEKFGFMKENMGLTPATARINPLLLFVDSIEPSFKNLLCYRFN